MMPAVLSKGMLGDIVRHLKMGGEDWGQANLAQTLGEQQWWAELQLLRYKVT
jgi:hypothetical protein